MRTARRILAAARTIAVVEASRDPMEPAHWVPKMLQEQGWRIIPVNPHAHRLIGEHVYGDLADVPYAVDIVCVFRPSSEAPEIVRAAAAIGARAVWLQRGIVSAQARRLAEAAGMDYVEDTCIGEERALSQMVVGGLTPPGRVWHGIGPQPEPVPGRAAPSPSRTLERPVRRATRRRSGRKVDRRRSGARQR
ncbi:hypothetical protein GCM10010170_066060 [Dactylosporangium salmoneum]|uniref:CoA-binding domain-containing protein n=1 Tax=Dactylosporangium salmoneum TaxID=53361 RepID=A0ABN3H1K8_9ACTN